MHEAMPRVLDRFRGSPLRYWGSQIGGFLSQNGACGQSRVMKKSPAPDVAMPFVIEQRSTCMFQPLNVLGCVLEKQANDGIARRSMEEAHGPQVFGLALVDRTR